MKKSILMRLAALFMASLFLFCSCGQKTQALTYKDGSYQNEKGDASFRRAPMNYRTKSVVTGTVKFNLSRSSKSDPIPLYAIEGVSADDWLTDENFTLYYNSSLTLPSLTEMNPYAITKCRSDDQTGTVLGQIGEDQQSAIDDVIEILTQGVSHPAEKVAAFPSEYCELLFESKEYPGFFYVLEYWIYDEDMQYVDENGEIEASTGIIYEDRYYVMGDILEDYFKSAE